MTLGRADASNIRHDSAIVARDQNELGDTGAIFTEQTAVSRAPRQPRGPARGHNERTAEMRNIQPMTASGHRDVSSCNSLFL